MLKKVSFNTYLVLKLTHNNIRILTASDTEAVVVIK